MEEFKKTFSMAVRTLTLVALPAAVGLGVLSRPIVRIIFEHGRFDAYSTAITSSALYFYAFGLLPCCFIKILVNSFYSMQDTRTPVKIMTFSVALNVILSLFFMRFLKIGGLALASTLSATCNASALYYFLRKKIGPVAEKEILGSFLRMSVAAAGMGAVAFFYDRRVLEVFAGHHRLSQALYLLLGIALSIVVYFIFTLLTGVREIRKFFKK